MDYTGNNKQLITIERCSARLKRGEEVSRVSVPKDHNRGAEVHSEENRKPQRSDKPGLYSIHGVLSYQTDVHPAGPKTRVQHARPFRCCLHKYPFTL